MSVTLVTCFGAEIKSGKMDDGVRIALSMPYLIDALILKIFVTKNNFHNLTIFYFLTSTSVPKVGANGAV